MLIPIEDRHGAWAPSRRGSKPLWASRRRKPFVPRLLRSAPEHARADSPRPLSRHRCDRVDGRVAVDADLFADVVGEERDRPSSPPRFSPPHGVYPVETAWALGRHAAPPSRGQVGKREALSTPAASMAPESAPQRFAFPRAPSSVPTPDRLLNALVRTSRFLQHLLAGDPREQARTKVAHTARPVRPGLPPICGLAGGQSGTSSLYLPECLRPICASGGRGRGKVGSETKPPISAFAPVFSRPLATIATFSPAPLHSALARRIGQGGAPRACRRWGGGEALGVLRPPLGAL
jgi:hypothetical protein